MNFFRIILFFLLFIVVITINCSRETSPIQPNFFNMDNELLIYSIVIDSLLVIPGKEWIVFLDSTEMWPIQNQDNSHFPNLQQNTINNYQMQNKQRYPFRISIDQKVKTAFISWEDWEMLGGWEGFYKSYPNSNGLVGFSRVGINDAGNQAVLYVSWNIHYLAGCGYIIILSRREQWQIEQIEIVWIS